MKGILGMSFKRRYVREFLAETLGTFALVLFGDGAVAQVAVKLKGWGPIAKLLPFNWSPNTAFCQYLGPRHSNKKIRIRKQCLGTS